ncbi:MAG: hypothetical protein AAFY28_11645, partial [Actinomycetota bacterium]
AETLDGLTRHRVRWVLTGSLVLVAHGADFAPGDIDVTPALDEDNLLAISQLLDELDAIPAHRPEWAACPPVDWHHAWSPQPATVDNLDHLFVTTTGMIDIVPSLCGSYDDLVGSATPIEVDGSEVLVADPLTVLARMEDAGRRSKDRARGQEIERVRNALARGDDTLRGLEHLITGR